MSDVLATAVSAVAGLVLAVIVSFGIVSGATGSPEPVDEPLVTYGAR